MFDTSAVHCSGERLTEWRQPVSEGLRSRFESSTFAGSRASEHRPFPPRPNQTPSTFPPTVCFNLVLTSETNKFSNLRRQHLPGHCYCLQPVPSKPAPLSSNWVIPKYQNTPKKLQTQKKDQSTVQMLSLNCH